MAEAGSRCPLSHDLVIRVTGESARDPPALVTHRGSSWCCCTPSGEWVDVSACPSVWDEAAYLCPSTQEAKMAASLAPSLNNVMGRVSQKTSN